MDLLARADVGTNPYIANVENANAYSLHLRFDPIGIFAKIRCHPSVCHDVAVLWVLTPYVGLTCALCNDHISRCALRKVELF